MIEYKITDDQALIEIKESCFVDEAAELKNNMLNALEEKKRIKLDVKVESDIHVSICLLIYAYFRKLKQINVEFEINDTQNILRASFNNLGLLKVYSEMDNIINGDKNG